MRFFTNRVCLLVLAFAAAFLAACGSEDATPPPTRAAPTAARVEATHTPAPTATRTATPAPTATFAPTATPTPHPALLDATIEGLRARAYPGGEIRITNTVTVTDAYTRTYITYPSDGLTISGLMHTPFGKGPFPVVILNHGYIPPSQYVTGSDTYRPADILARHGYITISPDFRGYARSDSGLNLFRTGYLVDALNAAASVKSLPNADPNRIGMWGHSMGGGVTARAMVVSPLIKAFVLYAPVSADVKVRRFNYPFGGSAPAGDAEVRVSVNYWADNVPLLNALSPINYFQYVRAPVQIHIGQADTTVEPEWSAQIRDELHKQGKYVEYYEYPRQGHAFVGNGWTLFNQRVVEFFDTYLK